MVPISSQYPIYTRPRFLPGTRIDGAKLVHSLLSEGGYIRSSVIRHSIIGIRTVIRKGCEIEYTYIMGADYYESKSRSVSRKRRVVPPIGVGENTVIRQAIIDKNVRVGKNVRIVNDENLEHVDANLYYIRNGIVVIPKGTIIPDETVI
jgi:glucose-1-phosphate adenylyltransferase